MIYIDDIYCYCFYVWIFILIGGNEMKKRRFNRVIAAVVIIVLLIGAISQVKKYYDGTGSLPEEKVISAGKVNIKYSDNDYKKAKSVTASVSPETPAAEINGISVDFGNYNLNEECTLEIKILKPKTDDALGLTAQLYDFTLTGTSGKLTEFPTLVNVTLPCAETEDEIAFLQYYNEKDDTWEMIPCSRNTEAGTISFKTNHFSGVAKFTSPGGVVVPIPGSIFSYVGEYKGQTTPVMITDGDIDKLLKYYNTETVRNTLLNGKVPENDAVSTSLGALNNVSSFADAATATELGLVDLSKIFTSNSLAKINPVLTTVGVGLTLGKMGYQLNNGVNFASVIKDNAFDMVESGLAICALATGAAPLAYAAVTVFAVGFIYETMLKSDEPSEWDEYTYHYFNRHNVYFNTATFEVKIQKSPVSEGDIKLDIGEAGASAAVAAIYKKHSADPKKLYSSLEKFINDYTNAFWGQSQSVVNKYYKDMLEELPFYNRLTAPESYPYPAYSAIKVYKYNFANKLKGSLQPLLKQYTEASYQELKQSLINEMVHNYLPLLNTVITFEMVDPSLNGKTFDNSKYAQNSVYSLMFGNPVTAGFNAGGLDYSSAKDHYFYITKNSNTVYQCTLFAYMSQGTPNTVAIDNLTPSNETVIVPFKAGIPITVITLDAQPSESVKSISFFDGSSYNMNSPTASEYEKAIFYALNTIDMTNVTLTKEGFTVIVNNSSKENKSERPKKSNSDDQYYKINDETHQLNNLIITGELKEGGSCTLTVKVKYTEHTEEVWLSASSNEYDTRDSVYDFVVKADGTVHLVNTTSLEEGDVKLAELLFSNVKVDVTKTWKTVDVDEFPNHPDINNRKTDSGGDTYTMPSPDPFTLSFYY